MIEKVRAYHEATKHRLSGYAPGPGFLDWDTQPDPFRHFDGAPVTELPFVPDVCGVSYGRLFAALTGAVVPWSVDSIGGFLGLAFGLSAWKSNGGDRWALRMNPSSGNLHPTEAYLVAWAGGDGVPAPGVYHYDAYSHVLEQRARFSAAAVEELQALFPGAFGALGLTSVHWREEWKYGARAYRYCQLDVGHAMGAARLSASALGWRMAPVTCIADGELAALLGLDRAPDFAGAEPETPDVLMAIGGSALVRPSATSPRLPAAEAWSGQASILGEDHLQWPEIRAVRSGVSKPVTTVPAPWGVPRAPEPDDVATEDAATVIRRRRSAQRMDKEAPTLDRAAFLRLLRRTLPDPGRAPFDILTLPPAISLVLSVHKVAGMEPGLYLFSRAPDHAGRLRAETVAAGFAWTAEPGLAGLFALSTPRDLRVILSKLCCNQGIAGHGAFAVGMLADMAAVLDAAGSWAYRPLHWEAGLIGQALYLEAENVGLRGTGIGCFLDDEAHALLGLKGPDGPWQMLYHFTVGAAKEDGRLAAEPAFAHLPTRGGRLQGAEALSALRKQIAHTWALREAAKTSVEAGAVSVREGLARLARIDAVLSDLDTRFSALWQAPEETAQ